MAWLQPRQRVGPLAGPRLAQQIKAGWEGGGDKGFARKRRVEIFGCPDYGYFADGLLFVYEEPEISRDMIL